MSDKASCACLRVKYDPEPVEFKNPVTKKPITAARDRWICELCGTEFDRAKWHKAVVQHQQAEIDRLTAECNEQARLNSMGSEREAKLMAERDRALAENARLREKHEFQFLAWWEMRDYLANCKGPLSIDQIIKEVDSFESAEMAEYRKACELTDKDNDG